MALTEEQEAQIIDRKYAQSPLAQRIERMAAEKAEAERAKIKVPEIPEARDYRGVTAQEDIEADAAGKPPTVELTTDDDFLPTLGEIGKKYDLREQAFQDERVGRVRRNGDVSNEFLRPGTTTVRGIDVSTGERLLDRGDFSNPEASASYREGVALIRQGGFNANEGMDENALRGITLVANGIIAEGSGKPEFLRAINQLGVPRAQADMAWSAAQRGRTQREVEDYLSMDYTEADVRDMPDPIPDIDKEELPGVDGWAEAARTVYETDNGAPFTGSDEELIDWYVDEMSNFNWKIGQIPGVNTSSMGAYAMRAMTNGPEYAAALNTLLQTYDRVNTDWDIVGNSLLALFSDPTSYVGLGGGIVAAKIGGQVAKRRMSALLTEMAGEKLTAQQVKSAGRRGVVAGGAAAGAIEGGVFTAADDVVRQGVAVKGGAQEEYSPGQTAAMGAAGVAAGAALGAGLSAVGPPLVAGGRRVGRRMLENARSGQKRGNMYRQIGAVGDISKAGPTWMRPEWASHPTLRNAFDFAAAGDFNDNIELKTGLQALARAVREKTGLDLSQDTPESNRMMRQLLAEDARTAMLSNQNAMGWYDATVGAAMEVLSEVHPELKTDPEANFAFKYALAVTSNQNRVDTNFRDAERAYRGWKEKKVMPDNVGTGPSKKAINKSLREFNALVKEFGYEGAERFMNDLWTAGQVKRITGKTPGKTKTDSLVRGAVIIGPKVGNGFFSNLNGHFEQLTVDRWFMATWGRHTGVLIDKKDDLIRKKRDGLKALVKEAKTKNKDVVEAFKGLGINLQATDPIRLAKEVRAKTSKAANREIMDRTDVGMKIRTTSNGLLQELTGEKLTPDNAGEWERIKGVMNGVLTDLRQDYPDLTMSDLQALLWYPEKRLYDRVRDKDAGEGFAEGETPDYAVAAAKLAEENGIDPNAIKEADRRGRERGTKRNDPEPGSEAGQERAKERARILKYRAFAKGRPGSPGGPKTRGYGKPSRGDAKGLRGVLNVYEPSSNYAKFLADAELPAVTLHELDPSTQAGTFRDTIAGVKANSKYGAAVYVYDDYSNMRLFMTPDATGGFAVKEDGDIVSVFSSGGGSVFSMLELAVTQGKGTKLDCFDTVLPEIYALAGFRETDRIPWDEQYKPEDWDKAVFSKFNKGEPDVVMMEYDPSYVPDWEPKVKKDPKVKNKPEVTPMRVMRKPKEPAVDAMGDPVAAFRRIADNPNVNNTLYDQLDFLQPDMGADEFMEALDEENVSSAVKGLMKALDSDDWLGFDSPSQALAAIMSERVDQFDLSARLKTAMGRYANEVTGD